MRKILILVANPVDTERLRLNEELRDIQNGLKLAKGRDQFQLISQVALRTEDLRRSLLEHEPQIVHFAGHGTEKNGLALEDHNGKAQLVNAQALARLFKLCSSVKCVVLNACYSEPQAKAIAQHVDYVIGMHKTIGDTAAKNFAIGFYDALGYGRSYKDAFEFGISAIDIESLSGTSVPKLQTRHSATDRAQNRDSVTSKRQRVFISYKRDTAPDEAVALELFQSLGHQHSVFIDQTMLVGTPWAERIRLEICQSDALIILLSEKSVYSQMVQKEISLAHEAAQERNGKPIILPVRLAYYEPFQYPLSAYLDPINWAVWHNAEDTPRIAAELQRALAGSSLPVDSIQDKVKFLKSSSSQGFPRPSSSAQPKEPNTQLLELPEGTMYPESFFYIERSSDHKAISAIERQGETIVIKGPRQMGKSSLLVRVIEAAKLKGKQIAFLDFQLFDKAALKNADDFFLQFCTWLTNQLKLENQTAEYWESGIGNNLRCTQYVGEYLLPALKRPLLLAMDEVESTFDTAFRSDFFGMLRAWHNNRAMKVIDPIWEQLDLALVTSTEPYQLIDNLEQSPFNVGEVIDLGDFTIDQVLILNQRHGNKLSLQAVEKLQRLLAGHPYLTRRALYLIASNAMTISELLNEATEEKGPFGDHLRWHLFRIYDKPHLVQGFLQVIKKQNCPDERIFFRLRGAGLVRREGKQVLPRCQLYARYFQEHLHG